MNARLAPAKQLALMIKLAAEHHHGQFDKGGRPYILHVLKVMHYLKDKDDDELNTIAVGHDIVEDTPITLNELAGWGFSARVRDGIAALTKKEKEVQSHNEYLLGILLSYDACRVKLADLRHNTDIRRLKGVKEKDLQRMQKYHKMHTQIKDMIGWYEDHHLYMYAYPGDFFAHRDDYAEDVLRMFDEN